MLQLNLLPDVKKELLHAKRMRNLVMTICFFVSAGAIVIVVLMGIFRGGMAIKKNSVINEVNQNIAKIEREKLSSQPLNDYLSVQNNLGQINSIKEGQPQLSRVFDYLDVIFGRTTPITGLHWGDWQEIKIAADSGVVTMELSGQVDSLDVRLMLRNRLYYAMVKYSEFSADGSGGVVEGNTRTDQKLFPLMVPTVDFEGGQRDDTTGKWPFKATLIFNPIVFQTKYRIQAVEIDFCTVWSSTYGVIGEGCQGEPTIPRNTEENE
ncbi:hypothetical protein FWD20_03635 [Candidatus Saccharibacteria bacterium]|nr:hypothetical protein [Candidatus Saccharibacteria bacterium]